MVGSDITEGVASWVRHRRRVSARSSPIHPIDKAFEREHIEPQQAARYEADAWEEAITTYLATANKTTIAAVATGGLGFKTDRIGTQDQRRITAIMTNLGWEPKRDMRGRWWARKP